MSRKLQIFGSGKSEICNFYAGKTIFITGAAGFLGTVLLETLLRCCPDISRIYILLRPKKGVQVEERKNLIFKKDIFIKLRATDPDVLHKVTAVSGDTSQDYLGLNESEYTKLTKEVSVVFHIAAAVSFFKPLGFTVQQNVIGTNYILEFCRKLENLKALVYTSTAFSNCNRKGIIEEKVYDLPFSVEEIIKLGRDNNEQEMMRLYGMCNPPFPNFYTFCKSVAENLLKEKAYDLPVCIIRPSIIFTSLRGPLPGYVEERSAIINLDVGVGIGFIRVLEVDKHKRIEIIPVDVTANAHIVAAFHQASKSLPSPSVYNCVTGDVVRHTWGDYRDNLLTMVRSKPLPHSYLYPAAMCCKNPILYRFLSLLLHYVPAAIADMILWISGSSIRLVKKYKFYDTVMRSVSFFTMNDWDFKNKNFLSLSQGLNAVEKKMFDVDLKDYTVDSIARSFPIGGEIYRRNGKPYEEKFIWKCLRYFVTFLVIFFHLGFLYSILYAIFKTWQWLL